MYWIYAIERYTYCTKYVLMDEQVKFRSKTNARAYLYTLAFSRKEQANFAILKFRVPPIWLEVPANYKGDL